MISGLIQNAQMTLSLFYVLSSIKKKNKKKKKEKKKKRKKKKKKNILIVLILSVTGILDFCPKSCMFYIPVVCMKAPVCLLKDEYLFYPVSNISPCYTNYECILLHKFY